MSLYLTDYSLEDTFHAQPLGHLANLTSGILRLEFCLLCIPQKYMIGACASLRKYHRMTSEQTLLHYSDQSGRELAAQLQRAFKVLSPGSNTECGPNSGFVIIYLIVAGPRHVLSLALQCVAIVMSGGKSEYHASIPF